MKELKKKIAEWLGWEFHPDGVHWRMSSDVLGWKMLENLPDFPNDIRACFDYIAPELDFYILSNWNKKKRPTASVFDGEGKCYIETASTQAMALCRAVEKLIDEST